ncbi:FMN-binding protein [Micromonospora sp. WMMD812]|uniref:FMN-binding protein n=1 Tax=Micromonospora sp. WMMD812 TaxID=3015152 RepID=UPI00248BD8FB|nr:FMN-binding protein [Micromonospora sp. WMMD812]WBB67104.1 FMN-binding protein [Micromonospora sp. WMMD812]
MRRAFLAITGLAASTTALVVLKGSPDASQTARDVPVGQASGLPAEPVAEPSGAAPAPATSAAPASARPGTSATPGRTPGTRGGGASTKPTTAAPRRTTAAPRTTSTTRTVSGPVVSNEYGNVQVQITVSGTRITKAVALELPDGGQSTQRSDRVDAAYSGTSGQVVQRQGADLDTVSGATATSSAYQQSLQAAIDQAR